MKEAEAAGRGVIDAVKNAKPEDAQRIYNGVIAAAKDWWNKPPREKVADVAEGSADIATDPMTYVPAAGALGKGGRLVAEGVDVAADVAKTGKRAAQAVKVEQRAVSGAHAAEKAKAGNGAVQKAVNLPGWKKVEIDMQHIMERHISGAPLAAGRTLFPAHMNENAIERAVRQAYRYGETVGGQGERVLVRGSAEGLRIEMWINKTTKTIETAYPVF